MGLTPSDVVKLVKDNNVKMIDFKFVDMPGIWQHYSIPAHRMSESLFEEGIGFDGSSIRGFAQIQESDMLVFPDPDTAFVDPLLQVPTLSLTCFVRDPMTLEPFSRDPRFIAHKAEKYLESTGIGDLSYWGPEAEFYIFNDIRFDQGAKLRLLLHRFAGRHLELGQGRETESGLPAAAQGRLLPGAPDGHVPGPAQQDHAGHGAGRDRRRSAPPRGRDGGSGRDRHEVRHPGAHGRQGDALQVRGQERLPQRRPLRQLHAQAPLSGQRLGDARPHVDLEQRASTCSTTSAAMRG